MTQHQADQLKRLVYEATGGRPPLIIDSHVPLDDMMRQVAHQTVTTVDCMTMQRLNTYLSEGMAVIMWGGHLGEELYPTLIRHHNVGYKINSVKYGLYFSDVDAVYHDCFDLLDRHEEEQPDGVIVDTLVAPYLALVTPQSNS